MSLWWILLLLWKHDGKLAGEGEDGRVREELEEKAKREHDQMIRARIRGNEALKKEKLKHVSMT